MFRSKKKKKTTSYSSPSGAVPFSWTQNLAFFCVIIAALISIPFLVLLLVLSVRTALDYGVWILSGIFLLAGVTALLLIRKRKQISKRFEEHKEDIMETIHAAAQKGHDVRISFMHGLIRIDYQGRNNSGRLLEGPAPSRLKALPAATHAKEPPQAAVVDLTSLSKPPTFSIAEELEKLSRLLEQGVVTTDEFNRLKERLLETKKQ